MEKDNVFQIAKREWDNISISLEKCGDSGNLGFGKFISTNSNLVSNLHDMDFKVLEYDYRTSEAGHVYNELVELAAQRLGLKSKYAKIFDRRITKIL